MFLFFHRGQTPAEAEFNLLDTARKVEMYGIRMHPAKVVLYLFIGNATETQKTWNVEPMLYWSCASITQTLYSIFSKSHVRLETVVKQCHYIARKVILIFSSATFMFNKPVSHLNRQL